jgi:hypothetical protein
MLETEIAFMETHREELIRQYGGRFLVIKGEQVSGAFDELEDALQGAVLKYGLDNVLIRRPADSQMEVSVPALTLGIIHANVSHPGSGEVPRS